MAEAEKKKSTYRRRDDLKPRAYIADPMYVCMRTFLRTTLKGRPNTILYPWEKLLMPDCFRGRPGIVLEKCIACGKCVKICPNKCIELVPIEHPTLGKVERPQIFVGRCMMCGYCAGGLPDQRHDSHPRVRAGLLRSDRADVRSFEVAARVQARLRGALPHGGALCPQGGKA